MNDYQRKEMTISPGGGNRYFWKEIWDHREMLYILGWRDFKVRYKQTLIGAAWSILRPLLTTVIFTYIFHDVAGMTDQEGIPYSLVVLVGTLAWQLFATGFQDSAASLLANSALISKVYFPRLIIPASALGTALVDFVITFGMVLIYMLYSGIYPGWQIITLPLFITLTIICAFGLGLLFAALTVKYRDLRFVIPFVVQFGLFVSPVGFRSSMLNGKYEWLFALNPLTGIIDGFRWALLKAPLDQSNLLISATVSLIVFATGLYYFRKEEMNFIDSL